MPRGAHDVFLEFTVQGAFVKVTAIDPQTGIEATILGPVTAPRSTLEQAALRKLSYVKSKNVAG
jgi:hypothetical protein